MPFGFSSSTNTPKTARTPAGLSPSSPRPAPDSTSTRIPYPSLQPTSPQGRTNQAQPNKGRPSAASHSSLPRIAKPRTSTSGNTSISSVPDSMRERGSSEMNESIGRTSRARDLPGHIQIPVGTRHSATNSSNDELGRPANGRGRGSGSRSPGRTNVTSPRSPTKTQSPTPKKDTMHSPGRPRKSDRSIKSPSSAHTYLQQSSVSSRMSSDVNAYRAVSTEPVQKTNSISKPNKNKTNLLWRLRSPSKAKDSGSRLQVQSPTENPMNTTSRTSSGTIASTNKTKSSAKTSLSSSRSGPTEVDPAASQNRESIFSPMSVLRSRSTLERSKSSPFGGKNQEKIKHRDQDQDQEQNQDQDHDKDKDKDETDEKGGSKHRGIPRSWSTDLPKATRRIVSNGLVLPSAKYPVNISSPLPSPLPLVPDRDTNIWAGNNETSENGGLMDSHSAPSAQTAPALARTTTMPTMSTAQSPRRAPTILATFGSRANEADLPIPIFLNGAPRTNYSRPMHHRSLSHLSATSSVSSFSSASISVASETILETINDNHYDNGEDGQIRNLTLFPSTMNAEGTAESKYRPNLDRSTSSIEVSKTAPIYKRNEKSSSASLPSVNRNISRNSSLSRRSSISTNSSSASSSVKDLNGQQPSSDQSAARFLRFSDLFPVPPDHPPFAQSRSNEKEISTPIIIEGDLPTRQSDLEFEESNGQFENHPSDLEDAVVKDADVAKSETKDGPISPVENKSTEWSDLGGGLYVCVSCVKHGYSSLSSSKESSTPGGTGVEDDDDDEEIVWKVVIRKKRPVQPPNVELNATQTSGQESERGNNLEPTLNSSTNTVTTATTSSSSRIHGYGAGITTPGETPRKRTMTNDLHSVSPLHPTEAISPSTNNTLSLTLSLSPSTFTTTSGRLTFLPIPSLIPPSPIKETFTLFRSTVSPSPTSFTSSTSSLTGAWSNAQIDGKPKRPAARNHIRSRSEFGQGWSGRSPSKGFVSRSHERAWSDVGMGAGKGLCASPKHYSLKDLAGESL